LIRSSGGWPAGSEGQEQADEAGRDGPVPNHEQAQAAPATAMADDGAVRKARSRARRRTNSSVNRQATPMNWLVPCPSEIDDRGEDEQQDDPAVRCSTG
jgi:hypothetical protein